MLYIMNYCNNINIIRNITDNKLMNNIITKILFINNKLCITNYEGTVFIFDNKYNLLKVMKLYSPEGKMINEPVKSIIHLKLTNTNIFSTANNNIKIIPFSKKEEKN